MNNSILTETISFNDAGIKVVSEDTDNNREKNYFMEGIFIQGEVENHNGRTYPYSEIKTAVNVINERLLRGLPVLGELDHPSDLQINTDRISHRITEMKMVGNDGVGKLKILSNLPMGKICKALLDEDIPLGVSSRGAGEVGSDGRVGSFEILTIDIVTNPSAPGAYPKAILEHLNRYTGTKHITELANYTNHDPKAQKYFKKEIVKWIRTGLFE